jgi:hypothetical protein
MSGLISLREAAIISGYHQDYLSFLIRKNKLNGEKIGRAWCLREEEFRIFLLKKNTVENIGDEKLEKMKEKMRFFDTRIKQVSFVLFFIFVSFLIFFRSNNDVRIKDVLNKKNGFAVNTIYSETASEVSSETSTKN